MKIARILTLSLLVALLTLLASCSSDDTTTTPDDDTDAPVVTQVEPNQDETDVSVGADVTITFNEDMDATSDDGNITLSPGTITDQTWLDDRTLEIEHADWPEGTEVTVTVGTGLSDVAGNGLAEAFSWRFWTETDDVLLLNTVPEDGATDVPLNTTVWLDFSEGMNGATLPGAITVTSPDKVDHPYTLDGYEDEWTLTFDADLPATTDITVTVATTAENIYGEPLASEASFVFTTGDAADETPPNLLSIEPADGASIPVGTSFLRLTFDEAIDDDSLQPSQVSGALMTSMEDADNAGVWSDNNTVFTVALATPLTPGAIFHVRFESYADVHGNVNTTPEEWTVTVAGTPDFMPVVDELLMGYMGTWSDEVRREGGALWRVTQYDVKTGGEFWVWNDEEWGFGPPPAKDFDFQDYERMRTTASEIQFLGFYEAEGGGDKAQFEVTFDPPIQWLQIPMPTGSYTNSGTSMFLPDPGEGPDRVDYTVTLDAGVTDIAVPDFDKQGDEPTILWMGCRKATIEYDVNDGSTTYNSGTDEIWFCPGVGPVRERSVSVEEFETIYTDLYLAMMGFESEE